MRKRVSYMEKTENVRELNLNTEKAKAIATIVVTAIVNILNVFGWAVDADAWIVCATSIVSAASIVWCWWKNQNLTAAAVAGQATIDAFKSEDIPMEEEGDTDAV